MIVLVTGGSGMVGKNFLEICNSTAMNIIAPTRSEMDLFNYNSTYNYILENKPDIIIHLAARVGGISANITSPVEFLIDNFDINRNLILAAKNANVKKILNIGSSCMYPVNAMNPLTEDILMSGKLEPTNEGYALSKIFSLKLCNMISKNNPSFIYKTIIPCNLFGKYDNFNENTSHLLPAIIEKTHMAIMNRKKHITIWGDGHSRREFLYVYDFVDFLLNAINIFDDLPRYMNVGTGYDLSINEYYELVAEVIGYDGGFKHDLSKPVGMKKKLVDITNQKKMNWMPKTDIDIAIKETYKFYLNDNKN